VRGPDISEEAEDQKMLTVRENKKSAEDLLPSEAELDRIEDLRKALEQHWTPDFSLHFDTLELRYEPKLYRFLSAYPGIDRWDLGRLSLALRFLVYATLMTDKIVDQDTDPRSFEQSFFHIQIYHFECYQILYGLFPPGSLFWQRFRSYFKDFAQACINERRFTRGEIPWRDCTEKRALEIIRGKNCFAQLLVASLAGLGGEEARFADLAGSIEKHYCAWQLWDDLCDWKEDFANGVPTLLLTRVVDELPAPDERQRWIPHLARKIYYEGYAQQSLDQAISLLDEADRQVADIPDLTWREVIANLRLECVALRDDLARIVTKNLQRARQQRPFELDAREPHEAFEKAAWGALGFLVDQWHLGFGEAQHIAYMARELGYQGPTELPSGDVFQRALILDALCDADRWLDGRLRPILDSEARYLLDQRNTSGAGGWRYFPSIPELAPDADDLGQVMQALLRAGFRSQVEEHCQTPLAVVRQDAHQQGGAFSTWIIPFEDRDGLEEAQAKLRGENWGPGPDNEVMANLLYALVLLDRQGFADLVDPGLNFLEDRQSKDGSWAAKWYFGPFYGTYVCLRLFASARAESATMATSKAFLLERQRDDGGWGDGDESDPLSTSLALLGLSEVCSTTGVDGSGEWARRGLEYLEQTRQTDGGWPSVPFISIPTYGSRTVTTLYVLKACLACGPGSTGDESMTNIPEKMRGES
jgi:squalene-hopene/tetraprenyl-beta-curcumene cyclase